MRPAVFLDLNGTLVMPLMHERLSELTLIRGADTAVAKLTAAGFVCPVVTVQSGIGKGRFTNSQFGLWFREFAAKLNFAGGTVVGPYVCSHRYREDCQCKKPNILLYERAADEHDIDLHHSFVIGDSASDVIAARRFGGKGCLVRTGWATIDKSVELEASNYAACVVDAVGDAADWIVRFKP